MTRPRRTSDTRTRILDEAEKLLQRLGYNGFSYADIAAKLKITTASLHYHFPGKAELGQALIERYAARFMAALAEIEARLHAAPAQLEAYAGLYADVLRQQRLCLCGMLAADYETLPKPMRVTIIRFFDDNEAWLSRILEAGREQGALHFEGPAAETARMLVYSFEGAMLVARPYGESARLQAVAKQLIAGLVQRATTEG
jgi:TetR/AcrR family transcriptional repressor of nem operon